MVVDFSGGGGKGVGGGRGGGVMSYQCLGQTTFSFTRI